MVMLQFKESFIELYRSGFFLIQLNCIEYFINICYEIVIEAGMSINLKNRSPLVSLSLT